MCHVLIIEDEPLIALDLEEILSGLGATSFDVADSEQQAVDAANCRKPAIITADVMLKIGRGPGAVDSIIARYGLIPVIYITGNPERCLGGETVRVLRKPVNEVAITRAYHSLRAAA